MRESPKGQVKSTFDLGHHTSTKVNQQHSRTGTSQVNPFDCDLVTQTNNRKKTDDRDNTQVKSNFDLVGSPKWMDGRVRQKTQGNLWTALCVQVGWLAGWLIDRLTD